METKKHAGLPDDMLIEIMSRCSTLETLATFRTTSKSLNLATYEPKFTHLNMTTGFLVQTMVRNNYVIDYVAADGEVTSEPQQPVLLNFLPLEVKINACSDELGLLYCESQERQSSYNGGNVNNHYICKGTTREWLQIPNPKTKGCYVYPSFASGMVVMKANPLKYKIIRLSSSGPNRRTNYAFGKYTCQVYDSEKPGKWKMLEKEVTLDDVRERISQNFPMVTVNENLHLLVGTGRILAFDSVTDEFDFIPTPLEIQEEKDSLSYKLFKYQGKLSMVLENKTEKTLTLWIMEDYKNKVWTRSCKLRIQPVNEIDDSAHLVRLCNSETGLFSSSYRIMFYNFRDGSYKRHVVYNYGDSVFGFQSDFKKMGWKMEEDAKGYKKRQDDKQRTKMIRSLEQAESKTT